MSVYAYARVSTQIQAEDGLSLDAQERQVQGYAMIHDMTIVHLFRERAVSGAKPLDKRPEGRKLLARLQPGDKVIVPKLDRMFRSAQDALAVAEQLQRKGVSLHLLDLGGDVTTSAVGKMFFTIVAAFAEFERDRIAERITDVKQNEREKGRFLGGAKPFGFRVTEEGALISDEKEQCVIQEVLRLRKLGASYREISSTVSGAHLRISHATVSRIVKVHGEKMAAQV